ASGQVREITIDRQSRVLGFLRLSDWVLVFLCSFGLLGTLSDVVPILVSSRRSDLIAPVDDVLIHLFIVVAVLSFSVYTGWRHIGVIDARVWRAHTIAFPMLTLLFPMTVAWDLQNGFPTTPKEQVEMVGNWFWPAVIAVSSLFWFVSVLLLQMTRISSLNISLVKLLSRLRRKRDLTRISTTRIERVNTPRGILLGALGLTLILPGSLIPWESLMNEKNLSAVMHLAQFIVLLRTAGVFLLLRARGYFQVRADSLLSVDRREPILFLRSFDDDAKGNTDKPTKALFDFSLETRLTNH